jgi:hypothetical protein
MTSPSGKVTLVDGDGRVITTLQLDENGEATYSQVMTEADKGIKTVRAYYTGDNTYLAGSEDTFTLRVANSATSQSLQVDKIIAGDGIYISPENGRGEVTISTSFIPQGPITDNLNAVAWLYEYPGVMSLYNIKQFTAVGDDGSNLRSRDGQAFARMGNYTGNDIFGVSVETAMEIPNGHTEYNGVGGTKSVYGRLSNVLCGDGMEIVSELTALNATVSGLKTTFAFQNGGCYADSFPAICPTDYGVAPDITSFTADPDSGACDSDTVLYWGIDSWTPLTSLTLNGVGISTSTVSYNYGHISTSTTYNLVATNQFGTTTASQTVSYAVISPIISLTSSRDSSNNVTVSWQMRNKCPITAQSINGESLSTSTRSVSLGQIYTATTYTLAATNCCGSFTAQTTVNPVNFNGTASIFTVVHSAQSVSTQTVTYPAGDLGVKIGISTTQDAAYTTKTYNLTMFGDNADRRLRKTGTLTTGTTDGGFVYYYVPLVYNDGDNKGNYHYADTYEGQAFPGNYTLSVSVTGTNSTSTIDLLIAGVPIRIE